MNVDLIKMNKLECLVPKPKGGCVQWKEPKGWVALTSEREISNGILSLTLTMIFIFTVIYAQKHLNGKLEFFFI